MNLDLVVQLFTDERPRKSFHIEEDLKYSVSFDRLRERDVEHAAIGAELFVERAPQFFVENGTKGPGRRHKHQIPDDILLHLDEGVLHWILVPQVELAILLKPVQEGIEDGEELQCK